MTGVGPNAALDLLPLTVVFGGAGTVGALIAGARRGAGDASVRYRLRATVPAGRVEARGRQRAELSTMVRDGSVLCGSSWRERAVTATGAVVVCVAGGLLFGWSVVVLTVAAIVVVTCSIATWLPRHLRHREQARRRAELPAALDSIARSLRSGGSLRAALLETLAGGVVAPALTRDLEDIARSLDLGFGLPEALRAWSIECPEGGVRFGAAALAVGSASGSLSARSVDEVASALRLRLEADAETRAQAAQAQVSALVMVVAPIVFLALVAAADPAVARVVTSTPIGWLVVAGGLALDAAAALAMRRIIGSVR